jgi:hypothetical protein
LETVTENSRTGESKVAGVSPEVLQQRVVDQGMQLGARATRPGARTVSKINTPQFKAAVDQRIAELDAQGKTIDSADIASRVDPSQMPDLNTADVAQNTKTVKGVRDKFLASQPVQMKPSEVQAFKVATDKSLGERAFQRISGPAESAELRLRTGAMEELENLLPDLKGLNQDTQTSIYLSRALLKAAKSTSTWRQATSLPNALTALGGFAVGGYKGAIVLPILKQIIDRPDVKSALAIAIDRMAKFKANQGISSQPLNPALYGQGEQDRQP